MSAPLRFDRCLQDQSGSPARWPRLALLGHPVGHSLSPQLHHAALRSDGREGEYRCVDVESGRLAEALADAAGSGVRGVNLTLPHKRDVLSLVERSSSEAAEVGAANTLVSFGGPAASSRVDAGGPDRWIAHNTDSRGLAMALERMLGRSLAKAVGRVVVVGSGGAARAAVHCVRALGAREICVASRDEARAGWAVEGGARWESLDQVSLDGVRLLIQCTPLGLHADDPAPLGLEGAGPELVVYDMVYGAQPSRLLRDASRRSLPHASGLSMLVAQAALAYSMWYGGLPPLEVMAAAVDLNW